MQFSQKAGICIFFVYTGRYRSASGRSLRERSRYQTFPKPVKQSQRKPLRLRESLFCDSVSSCGTSFQKCFILFYCLCRVSAAFVYGGLWALWKCTVFSHNFRVDTKIHYALYHFFQQISIFFGIVEYHVLLIFWVEPITLDLNRWVSV